MVREVKQWLESTLSGKIAPTVIALLCVGAIGTGANVVLAVGRLEVKVEQIQERNEAWDRQQEARLNRHDGRITYLERRAALDGYDGNNRATAAAR